MLLTMKYNNKNGPADDWGRDDATGGNKSNGSHGGGGGRLKNLLHRPSHRERQNSNGSSTYSRTPPETIYKHAIQQSSDVFLQRQEASKPSNNSAMVAVPFEENPRIPSSPSGTPPKKIWEGAYSKFLRSSKKAASPTGSSSFNPPQTIPSSQSPRSSPSEIPASTATSNTSRKSNSTGARKGSFSLIPGSKRLVARATSGPQPSLGRHHPNEFARLKQEVDYNNINLPPFPSLRRTSPRSFSRKQDGDGALNAHVHGRVITAVSSGPEKESSIRGGNLFKSVFSSGGNNNSSHDRKLLQDHHRRHQSMDALDVPLRKGIGKDSSVSLSPKHTFLAAEEQHHGSRAQTPENATQALAQLNTPRQIGDKDDDDASSLDDLLASAASTPSSQHMVVSLGGAQRTQSLGGLPQYMMNDAIGLSPGRWSAGTARPLYPRSSSYGYNVYRQDAHQYQNHFGIYNHQSISEDDVNLQMPIILPPPLGTHRYTLSEASENVGLTLDDSDNSHADENSLSRALENDGLALESSTLLRDSMGSQDFVANSGLILSSPYQGVQPTEDIKKVFTNFHNASHYARDSTTAYLGGRNSSVMNLAGAHDSHVSYHATLMRSAGGSLAYSGGTMSDRDVMLTSPPTLATVDEYGLSIHTDMRLLKPIQGTDAWQPGRRYLIAPAALSACPLPSINKLLGSLVRSASEACTSSNLKGFGTVNLGDALMTYIGEKHHLSLGKWSSSKLVLRQNYLFEYHTTTPINGLPRGYVHLQYAVAYKHLDFPDVLELKFYGSPCAKSDHRTLRIKVKNHIERDYWITCLNKAANLNIEDIWEIDQDNCLGVGRYATVLPARRKTNLSDESNSCALKVIDKNEFWRRVVKGRERADTLVRELAVQATLTAKCSQTVPTFLQLRGFFESSDKIVIELELLEGTDLFHHIQSMGSLCEEEAAHIIQDVLTSLDSMNRNGLAHRDIKPANILVSDRSKSGASVKLCDFGMSTFVGVDGLVRGRCGTPGYVAPEILTAGTRAGYGNQVDVFSAGVTLYLMLSGVEPFYGESEEELVADNTRCEITFPNKYWGQISEPAKDLVCQMMQADPSKRVTAKGALQHPWLLEMVEKQAHIEGVASSADIPEEGVCTLM